jgi:proline iminopeptidase
MSNKSADEQFLYPPLEPFATGTLEVSKLHSIYYEQCGNKAGLPVIYIHGYRTDILYLF